MNNEQVYGLCYKNTNPEQLAVNHRLEEADRALRGRDREKGQEKGMYGWKERNRYSRKARQC